MGPSYLELFPFPGPDSVSPDMGRGEGFAALYFRMGIIGCIQVGVGIWGIAKQFSSSFSKEVGTGVQSGSRKHFNIWPRDWKVARPLVCPTLGLNILNWSVSA